MFGADRRGTAAAPARRIAELINENGDVHRFVYDALDRLTEEMTFSDNL